MVKAESLAEATRANAAIATMGMMEDIISLVMIIMIALALALMLREGPRLGSPGPRLHLRRSRLRTEGASKR